MHLLLLFFLLLVFFPLLLKKHPEWFWLPFKLREITASLAEFYVGFDSTPSVLHGSVQIGFNLVLLVVDDLSGCDVVGQIPERHEVADPEPLPDPLLLPVRVLVEHRRQVRHFVVGTRACWLLLEQLLQGLLLHYVLRGICAGFGKLFEFLGVVLKRRHNSSRHALFLFEIS